MSARLVRLADVLPQPWRNGGGSTRELLAWPQAEGWAVRVSVATISRDGPFSAFPGVQRWFAVLQGAGVVLALPQGSVRCTPDSDAVAFDGAAAPGCNLLDGATEDLNLMTAHAAGQARMWRAVAGDTLRAGSRWRGVFACDALQVRTAAGPQHVPASALLWADEADAGAWHLPAPGRAWCMELCA
jgi:environmental stress-induced protein Ves